MHPATQREDVIDDQYDELVVAHGCCARRMRSEYDRLVEKLLTSLAHRNVPACGLRQWELINRKFTHNELHMLRDALEFRDWITVGWTGQKQQRLYRITGLGIQQLEAMT